jgi:hypothetical protein
MRKTVVCRQCKVAFAVGGTLGILKETVHSVTCPYPDCEAPNEVNWPLDGFCKSVPMYKPASMLRSD